MVTALIRKKIQRIRLAKFIRGDQNLARSREYVQLVEEMRQEWRWAEQLAAESTAGNRIDQVLCYQEAAKQCYFYLLAKAAEENIHVDSEMMIYFAFSSRNGSRQW